MPCHHHHLIFQCTGARTRACPGVPQTHLVLHVVHVQKFVVAAEHRAGTHVCYRSLAKSDASFRTTILSTQTETSWLAAAAWLDFSTKLDQEWLKVTEKKNKMCVKSARQRKHSLGMGS